MDKQVMIFSAAILTISAALSFIESQSPWTQALLVWCALVQWGSLLVPIAPKREAWKPRTWARGEQYYSGIAIAVSFVLLVLSIIH